VKIKIHKLSFRYLLTFSLMVLLPFFLFGFFINYYYGRYLIDGMEKRMSETAYQVAQNLENEIRNVSILSSALVHNPDFLKACSSYSRAETAADTYLFQEVLDFHLTNMFLYTNKIGSVYVYIKNKPPYIFRNYPAENNLPTSIDLDSQAFREIKNDRNVIHIEDNLFRMYSRDYKDKEPLLSLLVNPEEEPYGRDLTAVLFAFRVDVLKQLNRLSPTIRKVILTDKNGGILLKNISDRDAEGILAQKERASGNKGWVLASAKIPSTKWTIIQASERRILLAPFLKIRFIFNLILTGILLIFFLYTMLFFHNMITPLNNLVEKMDHVEQGDYSVRVQASGPEEMQHLQLAFNSMIQQVNHLTREKEENEKEKNRLELQALQYQINPHFIANTLNSIRMMAVVNKNEHIKNMTASLMRLVNDSFRGRGNINTLEDEENSLSSYVHIMKVRFGNPIDLRFSFPEELKKISIRKMLLQPLVENSIIHGFQQGRKKGIILIQAFQRDEKLNLRVTDNGEGMNTILLGTREKESPRGLTALGLESVNRRIQLNFGNNYGLGIRSKQDHYTSVTLSLPLNDPLEEV